MSLRIGALLSTMVRATHLARVVELEGLYFSNLNAIEVHAATFAQTAGGTFENDAERSLLRDAVDFRYPSKPTNAAAMTASVMDPIMRLLARAFIPESGCRCARLIDLVHFAIARLYRQS